MSLALVTPLQYRLPFTAVAANYAGAHVPANSSTSPWWPQMEGT